MKLAIPLLVAAVLVVILAIRALQDEPLPQTGPRESAPDTAIAMTPSEPSPQLPPPATDSDATEKTTNEEISDTDFLMLLREYGFEQLEANWREWAMSRGYPAMGVAGQYNLEQPYDQYDNETLKGLADNGDKWAQQILAKRISRTNPAEAIELYRKAAVRGSVYAMSEMANLYLRISDKRREVEFKSDELALEQVYAMRDAPVAPEVAGYAWTAVAEMAGTEPMFGNIASSQFSRKLSDEQKTEGCEIARSMYEEVTTQRESLGLGDFDRTPPPLVYSDPNASAGCSESNEPRLDLSGCRRMQMTREGQTNVIWLCADAPS
ncbi:MAG: hypothetical protein OER80_09480 [Gammaproteobacteria bacterium]|nr:hypothetical protein [Gammaproteobacteria bacterium]MDH3767491.1 hypothetical protein [Gammaproteobacteria bacterium]